MTPLLNTRDLMNIFGCSRTSLRTMRKTHGFPAPVPGVVGLKWRREDIESWLANK